MYISDTPHNPPPKSSMDFSDDDGGGNHQDMMIEMAATSSNPHHAHTQHHHVHSHSNHHHAPKKRAETWVHDETRSLIGLRREMDSMFNTSKSNKHLWEKISARMREKGFDRSPTMCTDKWRNLLKEFKKSKQQHMNNGNGNGNNGNAKMSYYKEIEEILRDRNRCSNPPNSNSNAAATAYKTPTADAANHALKVDPFMQFSDKGVDDASIQFGPIEANGGPGLNLEESMEHEGHALAITAAEAVAGDGVPPSFWQETPGNGDETHCYSGRVITVKWGEYTRRVGVDGSADAIKDVIRSAFGLRTKRAFWLEDEEQVVRSLDRDMPLGTYTLHLDQGITIKLCLYNESDHIPYPSQSLAHTVEKTFYTEEDFREFMHRQGWSCLRELDGFREIDNLDDLRPDALYRGVTWDSHGT